MKFRLNETWLPLSVTITVAVLLYVAAGLRFQGFFSLPVLANFFTDNAVLGIVAMGLTFVILSGEIDLSVGAMTALSSVIMAKLIMQAHWHPAAAAALTLLIGLFFGAGTGCLVHCCGIPGFLVTLGGLFLARGLGYLLQLESLSIDHPLFGKAADWRISLATGRFELPLPACSFLGVFLVAVILGHYTRFGRNVYALGGNEQSAALMGLPVGKTRVGVFMISGFCSSFAGVIYGLYTFSGNPNAATGLELDAIAAVIIGGTLLTGGVGFVAGTLAGVLIFGMIQTAITFEGTLSSWWTKIVVGILLLLFLLIQKLLQTKTLRALTMKCFLLSLLLSGPVVVCSAVTYQNPVIPGDYPDPSVIRVGRDYYATATTSEWAPIFPILHSRDLVNWTNIGAVFPREPEWSAGNYWAPEIAAHNGKYFVYYVARKKNGPLSVAVATADKPEGPYTDHGVMVSQEAGSIDPVPVQDENGKRFLIWKEDGNSRKQPTPLWIQELSSDGTRLVGEMTEILRNEPETWEGPVIEGPFVMRHQDYFYLFYSGNACCGRGCHYGLGVARAKRLLGPWEKYPKNPLLADNALWRCPGHGSIVRDEKGDPYLLYHAYHAADFIYVGRQALLDKIVFESDGWPALNRRQGPSFEAPAPYDDRTSEHRQWNFSDDFAGDRLDPEWQWPWRNEPRFSLSTEHHGSLLLRPNPARAEDLLGGVLALKTTSGSYQATAVLRRDKLTSGTSAGLCAMGDLENALGVAVNAGQARLWRRARNQTAVLHALDLPRSDRILLRLTSSAGRQLKFSMSVDGANWIEMPREAPVDGGYLPPWDRGIRVALTVGGSPDAAAIFESMELRSEPPQLRP